MEKLVPKLRFPEFDGDWSEKKVSELGDFFGGGTPDSSNSNYWKGNIPWISSSDINEDSLFKISKTRFITSEAVQESATKIIPKGSILMVSRVGIGKFAVADEDLCTSQDFTNLVSNQNEYFLAYYFKGRSNRFIKLSQGTSIQGFTTKDLKSAIFLIPKISEQQKIASFLTSVDERITLLEKQKMGLETYKNGVMQQIFSQKLRFKDDKGNDFPDWEEKKLGEIGYFQTSSIDKLSKNDEKSVYLVNYMNVYRHENINNNRVKSFQIVTAKDNQIESCNLKKGDILFTPSSETPDDIGHSVVIFEDLEDTVFSYHLMRFRPTIDIDILYSHYFCNVPEVLNQLTKYSTGSTRFTISVGNFSKVKIQLPCLEEQQKIATFLSAIDARIEVVSKQIEQSKVFKKGLLQQMFV